MHLVDINQGFVATTMVERLPLPGPLGLTPDKVAKDIVRAVEKKYMLYTLWFWWDIMLINRDVPRFVFTGPRSESDL